MTGIIESMTFEQAMQAYGEGFITDKARDVFIRRLFRDLECKEHSGVKRMWAICNAYHLGYETVKRAIYKRKDLDEAGL